MGIRVEFYQGARDGLESILIEHMPEFRNWSEEQKDFPSSVLHAAERVIEIGGDAFLADSHVAAREIDLLTDYFVCGYCDYGPGRNILGSPCTNMLKIHNYQACLPYIVATHDLELVSWWELMLSGRPIRRNPVPFPYSGGGIPVSFATAEEIPRFLRTLEKIRILKSNEDAREAGWAGSARSVAIEAMNIAASRKTGLVITIV